jgi:hypothetical protein
MQQPKGMVVGIIIVAALLAVPACAGEKSALPDDLKLVSGDRGGFVSVRVADLLKSAQAKELFEKLAKMEPKVDIDKELKGETGVALAQIERMTVLLPDSVAAEPVFVIRTTEALAPEKILGNLRYKTEKKELQGKTYYGGINPNVKHQSVHYFVNDRVFLAGSERSVLPWLERDLAKIDAGAYRPALLRTAQGAPAVISLGLPLLTQMAQPLPKELSDLLQPKSALLTVVCEKDTQADLRLTFANAKAATDAAGALIGSIGLCRQQIPMVRGELSKAGDQGRPLPESLQMALKQADLLLQQADKALLDAKVSAEGMTVRATASSQTEAGQLVIATAMLGFGIRAEVQLAPPAAVPAKKEVKKGQ